MSRRRRDVPEGWIIASIVAAAALLRFARLGHQSLWTDELLSIGTYAPTESAPYWRKFLWDVHGPLYSLILHFWSRLSSAEAWLRAPSAIAGTASVYLIYRWLISLRRRDSALIGALFLALSPFHLYYSQELRFYAQLAFMLVLSLIVFQRYIARPSAANGALLGVALAVTCMSHFSGGFLCLGLLVYLVVTGRMRGRHLRGALIAAVITLAVISPWIYREIRFLQGIRIVDVSTIPVVDRFRGEMTLSPWAYPYSFYAFSAGYSLGPTLRDLHLIRSPAELLAAYGIEIVPVFFVFGLLILAGLVRSGRTGHLPLLASIAAVTLLSVSLLTKFNVKIWNARYLMSAFPVFIALLAFGVPAAGWRRYLAIGTVCALMLVADWNYLFNDRYARDDVRGAVRFIEERESPGDLILAPSIHDVVKHYYRGSNEVNVLLPREITAQEMRLRAERFMSRHGRVWYLRCRQWDTDPRDEIPAFFSSGAIQVLSWEFPGIRLYLFRTGGSMIQHE